jgi:ABC-type oligopeptide transport system substrate-binding subunit
MTRRTTWLVALVAGVLALVAVGCAGGDDEAAGDNDQVITVNWGTEPPSLDPGLATDTTSSSILLNLMDPLVLLDESLEPQPGIAESWEVAGTTVTYHLRPDGRWTNGDPVTAQDYEWSWKRTISPDLAADYAYQFFGIVGAADYNSCESNCDAMRDKVGVTAVNDRTLRVELTSPQPWFVQQSAHTSFLAVHRPTVEQFGERWTEPRNIVTNGPFRLERWDHNSRIDLVKWDQWRNADEIALQRVNGRMISEGLTAVQAFEANEIDAQVGGLPPEELPRLKDTDGYAQYPSLGTYYYGINVENVPDANQRRAMALAIDRQSIIDNVAQADQIPASGFTPQGMPGFETLTPDSEWLPADGDIDRAKELMERVQSPQRNVTLVINDAPGHREIAVAIQSMWSELGIDTEIQQQEWAQFLESIGPPPGKQIDAFRLGWIADYVDAMNFLELWTCDSGNNSTNFCNQEYDGIVEQARRTADNAERYELYGRLEQILFGPDGDVPIMPIYWYTFTQLEDPAIKDTFGISQTGQIDLRGVVEGDGGGNEDV